MRKIKLGRYPYTYVRAIVMRSMLVKREDYYKFLKMSLNGIIGILQESIYKKEIDKLAAEYSGMELLELALKENLAASFNKLRKISPPELRLLINAYSKRRDIEDTKSVLRAKYTKADEKEFRKIIHAAGTLDYEFFLKLYKMDSIEDILKNLKIVPFNRLEKAYEKLKKENNLSEIETELDHFYYWEVLNFAKLLPKEGTMFKEFLRSEIDVKNIMTLLRLYREKMSREEIKEYLFFAGAEVQELIKSSNLDELLDKLGKTKYKDVIKNGIEKLKQENTLIDIEISLYNYLLKKSVLLVHQHPLSVDAILGYMFAKEVEIRNLEIITKGKQLGLSEEFIEKQLVMI